jgi:glycosyltransferase involved in cell wall biosynthesis
MDPAVLHLDSSNSWGGGQNQVFLLMRGLAKGSVRQLCICPTNSPLEQRLLAAELPVQGIAWRGGSDPRVLWSVARSLPAFDIAHCHDAHALQLAILPARLQRKKLIAARRVVFPASSWKWNRADRVIAISRTVRDALIRSGIDAQRTRTIYSGIDIEAIRATPFAQPTWRQRLGIPASAFVVANAASLIRLKGHTMIPQAAALLPDVQWLIAGEGPQRNDIETAIQRHRVADRVHLLGWVPDARQLLKEADAYVSPALEEGLGNAILEALALRIPVLSAAAGGGAEVMQPVQERTQAVFFESADPQSLVRALQCVREPDMRAAVLAAQDERIADFAIQRTVAATLAIYREVLAP